MKSILPFIIFFCFFTVSGFAQFDRMDPESVIQEAHRLALENQKQTTNDRLRTVDEDDLLLALRMDNYNTELQMWSNGDSTVYTYDAEGRWIELLTKRESGGIWENWRRVSVTYNDEGLRILAIAEIWNGSDWSINTRESYEYDDEGNQVLLTFEISGINGLEWVLLYRIVSTWGTEGEFLERTFELWDEDLMTWEPDNRIRFEYNAEMLLSIGYTDNWENGAWANLSRSTYAYNNAGLQDSLLREDWNGSAWENITLQLFEYNEEDQLDFSILRRWESGDWVNGSRFSYNYENGLRTYYLIESWDGGEWMPNLEQVLEYDSEANNTFYIIRIWDEEAAVLVNDFRIFYYYQIITNTEDLLSSDTKFAIYPNPGDGIFTVEYDLENLEETTLEVYNTLGQVVHRIQMETSEERTRLNLTHLGKGTYIVRWYNAEWEQSKMVQILD